MQRANGNHPVAVQLRQEVSFACAICGAAILTYHHFDPPWGVREHNNPEGIALCIDCHKRADRGTWTIGQLREFKRNPTGPAQVREKFFWAESDRSILYRLGGAYGLSNPVLLSIGNAPVLWEDRTSDGRLLFSLDVRDERNRPLVSLRQNTISVEALNLWDVHFAEGATRIVLRRNKGDIVFSMRFRRLSLDGLGKLLDEDARQAQAFIRKLCGGEPREEYDHGQPRGALTREILASAERNCVDSDGTVPFVNISNATLFGDNGRKVIVRNGLGVGKAGMRSVFAEGNDVAFAF